ncbi:MAG: tRNA lysidine(34) synthetase TilS [Acidobacteria bacterium RIFCSPLOWO2_12_FULL_65_11]|nr:MAG: tRNA lysidine(34) synthetase TilS [Acidobacteria bacterium RIFCSPLOWO2_02_FULL_64_15]OFW33018.1 MAG: tRNA lysidine(34) synthetase TilS [Acidobacteria bacterium RIFCSPLOWO2_12_FULL_65_11]
MRIVDRVRDFSRRHHLFGSETRVVVALSGGSDSVALAHVMAALAGQDAVRVVGLAHFNHQLRETATRDEQVSAAVAASLGVPIEIDRGDVAARARLERRSIEDAARRSRHEFLERVRQRLGADEVALGHTRDDQAETFLLRLIRGAGPRGLAGIHPRHGAMIRPLLDCRRHDLRAYLDERGIGYVEDETNADVGIPRNRVRAELLPLLVERFNPRIVDVLADEAELARETWQWMEEASTNLISRSLTSHVSSEISSGPEPLAVSPEPAVFDIPALMMAPAPLRRLVLWRAMSDVARGRPVSFRHVEAALRLAEADRDGAVDAPGQRVQRDGPRLVLTGRPPASVGRLVNPGNLFEYPLSIPGAVQLTEAGCVVSVEPAGAGPPGPSGSPGIVDEWSGAGEADWRARAEAGRGEVALVRGDLCRGPLLVRNRRPGDRFRPVGLGGRKKLQDFFVDRKVARKCRDFVPIVVDQAGRIVWVAGHGIDEAYRVTDVSQGVLILRLKLVGGVA